MGGKGGRKYRQHDDDLYSRSHSGNHNWNRRHHHPRQSSSKVTHLGGYAVTARQPSFTTNDNAYQEPHKSSTQRPQRQDQYPRRNLHSSHPQHHQHSNPVSRPQTQQPISRHRNNKNKSAHPASWRLKQHLIHTIEQFIEELRNWHPEYEDQDGVEEESCHLPFGGLGNADSSGMEWQPEDMVIIPQIEEVKYCWDFSSGSSEEVEMDVVDDGDDDEMVVNGVEIEDSALETDCFGNIQDMRDGMKMEGRGKTEGDEDEEQEKGDFFVPVPRRGEEGMGMRLQMERRAGTV